VAQALPTTQPHNLPCTLSHPANAWAQSSYPSSLIESSVAVPASRAGLPPAAGDGGTLPAAAPAVQSSIHHHPRPHHYRQFAERRQPIAGLRGCSNRGPSSREVRRVALELRDAMEGAWFPIMLLDRLAELILSGHGDANMVAELVQGVRRLPPILRPAHRLLQDLCEAESEDTGQLTFRLPGAGRRCA